LTPSCGKAGSSVSATELAASQVKPDWTMYLTKPRRLRPFSRYFRTSSLIFAYERLRRSGGPIAMDGKSHFPPRGGIYQIRGGKASKNRPVSDPSPLRLPYLCFILSGPERFLAFGPEICYSAREQKYGVADLYFGHNPGSFHVERRRYRI